jgi:hypothetical protein
MSSGRMTVKNSLEMMCKEAIVAYFNVLSQYFLECIERNNEKLQ